MEQTKHDEFKKEIEEIINKYSRENGSDTPDFILADYLCDCFCAFDSAVRKREAWYGREAGDSTNATAPGRHTPGPWKIMAPEDMPGFYCLQNHVERLEEDYDSEDPKRQEVSFEEEKANARLIAIAPELLGTLHEVFNDWLTLVDIDIGSIPDVTKIYDRVVATIAKAEGKEPVSGDQAVECTKPDLFGELLEMCYLACEQLDEWGRGENKENVEANNLYVYQKIRDTIAKVKGER